MTSVKPNASFWNDIISYRPPKSSLGGLHFMEGVQAIEEARGEKVNLDFYSVHVTSLPKINGVDVPAQKILAHILQRTSSFVDNSYGRFEEPNWRPGLVGTVIHIEMGDPKGTFKNPDDGSVILSSLTPTSFVFTTVATHRDHGHPVSGNRQFGFVALEDGTYLYYTRGADRPEGIADNWFSGIGFNSAEELWRSFQAGIVKYIKDNGGSAKALSAITYRPLWSTIEADHIQVSDQAPADPAIELLPSVLLGKKLPARSTSVPVPDSQPMPIETPEPGLQGTKKPSRVPIKRHDPLSHPMNPINPNSPLHHSPLNDLMNPMNPNSPLHHNPFDNQRNPLNPNRPWDVGNPISRGTTIGTSNPISAPLGPIRHADAPGRTVLGPVKATTPKVDWSASDRVRPHIYYTPRYVPASDSSVGVRLEYIPHKVWR